MAQLSYIINTSGLRLIALNQNFYSTGDSAPQAPKHRKSLQVMPCSCLKTCHGHTNYTLYRHTTSPTIPQDKGCTPQSAPSHTLPTLPLHPFLDVCIPVPYVMLPDIAGWVAPRCTMESNAGGILLAKAWCSEINIAIQHMKPLVKSSMSQSPGMPCQHFKDIRQASEGISIKHISCQKVEITIWPAALSLMINLL